jgi:hypothetical protein
MATLQSCDKPDRLTRPNQQRTWKSHDTIVAALFNVNVNEIEAHWDWSIDLCRDCFAEAMEYLNRGGLIPNMLVTVRIL